MSKNFLGPIFFPILLNFIQFCRNLYNFVKQKFLDTILSNFIQFCPISSFFIILSLIWFCWIMNFFLGIRFCHFISIWSCPILSDFFIFFFFGSMLFNFFSLLFFFFHFFPIETNCIQFCTILLNFVLGLILSSSVHFFCWVQFCQIWFNFVNFFIQFCPWSDFVQFYLILLNFIQLWPILSIFPILIYLNNFIPFCVILANFAQCCSIFSFGLMWCYFSLVQFFKI